MAVHYWFINVMNSMCETRRLLSKRHLVFTARRIYASAVLRVVILSVCPSHACFVTKPNNALRIFWYPYERAITLVFWHQQWLADAPFRYKFELKLTYPFEKRRLGRISAYNVSTARDSENSSITTNRKSTKGFPTSYRWSAYVIPKSPKGGSESDLLFFFE